MLIYRDFLSCGEVFGEVRQRRGRISAVSSGRSLLRVGCVRDRPAAALVLPSRAAPARIIPPGRPRDGFALPRELGRVSSAARRRLRIDSLPVAPRDVVDQPDGRDTSHRDATVREAKKLRLNSPAVLAMRTVRPVFRQARPTLDRVVVVLGRKPSEARRDRSPERAGVGVPGQLGEPSSIAARSASEDERLRRLRFLAGATWFLRSGRRRLRMLEAARRRERLVHDAPVFIVLDDPELARLRNSMSQARPFWVG
jgi:hypothetical protein